MNNPAPKRLSNKSLYDRRAVTEAVQLVVGAGNVTELRVLDATTAADRRPHTESGYFDDPEMLADSLATIKSAKGIYVVLNPVETALLARANNRLRPTPRGEATADTNITRRRWFPIDLDPLRPSGISASEVEHEAAIQRTREIYAYLKSLGWPDPIVADSGNGAHLLYGIDLPPDDGGLVRLCLQALATRFDDEGVKVDTSVHNPSRIWKVYGSVTCKGDDTPDRPHRMAQILRRPLAIDIVGEALLEALVAESELTSSTVHCRAVSGSSGESFDLEGFIARNGLDVAGPHPWNGEQGPGQSWSLRTSPMCEHHGDGVFIVRHASGAITATCHHNSCNWGWAELRARFEPKSTARRTKRDSNQTPPPAAGTSETEWPDPEPLPGELAPVAPFRGELLPEVFRPHVMDIAERMQCPPDFPAVAIMIVEATVLGRRIGICPKRHDDWLVTANLWGAVVGRPGLMKTPAIAEPLKFLKRLEVASKQEYEAALRDFGAQELVQKARRSLDERQIKKALSEGKDAQEIAAAMLNDALAPPVRQRFLCNDSSVEKLGEILNENPNGILVFRDELIGFLRKLESDGQESARAFYLEAWNGNGRFTYDRIGRGTIDIEAAIVSVLGGIQPGPFGEYLREATKQGRGDDGLIQRMQLTVWPDLKGPWRNVDCWPDSDAKNTAWSALRRLHDATFEMFPTNDDGIKFLRFADPAQTEFNAWRTRLEERLRSGELHAAMESHLAKFRSLVPTLALLIELAERPKAPSVSAESLGRAIGWADYLETHANRLYGPAIQRDLVAARALASKIASGKLKDGFALRDVYRAGWTHLADRDDALRGTGVLIDCQWLKVEQQATDGRTATHFRINPKVGAGSPWAADKADKSPNADPSVGSVGPSAGASPIISDDEWGDV